MSGAPPQVDIEAYTAKDVRLRNRASQITSTCFGEVRVGVATRNASYHVSKLLLRSPPRTLPSRSWKAEQQHHLPREWGGRRDIP